MAKNKEKSTSVVEKLEKFLDNYIKDIEEKPVRTILKTLFVAWIVGVVVRTLKKSF